MSQSWEILEIDESASRQDIRRAYARRLRIVRPDEDPSGFQELHEAYKLGLMLADAGEFSHSDQAGSTTIDGPPDVFARIDNHNLGHALDQDVVDTQLEPHDAADSEVQEIVDTLASSTAELLSSQKRLQQAGNWGFITESGDLLDDRIRERLGCEVLRLIVARDRGFNSDQLTRIVVPNYILRDLDEIFLWSMYPDFFSEAIGTDLLFTVLDRVEKGREPLDAWSDSSDSYGDSQQSDAWGHMVYRGLVFIFLLPVILRTCDIA